MKHLSINATFRPSWASSGIQNWCIHNQYASYMYTHNTHRHALYIITWSAWKVESPQSRSDLSAMYLVMHFRNNSRCKHKLYLYFCHDKQCACVHYTDIYYCIVVVILLYIDCGLWSMYILLKIIVRMFQHIYTLTHKHICTHGQNRWQQNEKHMWGLHGL